jgi:hypothetical protein
VNFSSFFDGGLKEEEEMKEAFPSLLRGPPLGAGIIWVLGVNEPQIYWPPPKSSKVTGETNQMTFFIG